MDIEQSKELRFADWIDSVFKSTPVLETVAVGLDEFQEIEESSHSTISNLTNLFLNAHELLKDYSDEEVSQGLYYLASNNFSQTMYALLDEEVPWVERQTCIQVMYTLFEQFFTRRCLPELSFPDRDVANPINFICCHWFDLLPLHGRREVADNINLEFLDVFRKVLTIDSDICQEGALSGLGSWRLYFPIEANQILDEFLMNNPDLRIELRKTVFLARRSMNIL